MGLDTSHDCWHGAYSSFMQWRKAIAKAAGYPALKEMEGFGGNIAWSTVKDSPLIELLNHSDCDGSIKWQHCKGIADALGSLLPELAQIDPCDDWIYHKTVDFMDGLRRASSAKENVEFY